MDLPLLDPRNDLVFKLIFADALPLLTDVINAVRITAEPLKVIQVNNPAILPEEIDGKFIVLDINATADDGRLLNIEMQMLQHEQWSARGVFYLANLFAGQLKKGEAYSGLNPVIGVHLLNYSLFPEHLRKALWRFMLRDEFLPDIILGSEIEINIIELNKISASTRLPRTQNKARLAALKSWIAFLTGNTAAVRKIAHLPTLIAMEKLQHISADSAVRELVNRREIAARLAEMERQALLEAGTKKGHKEGEAVGLKKGKALGRKEGEAIGIQKGEAIGIQKGEAIGAQKLAMAMAEKLLSRGMPVEEVADVVGLPVAELVRAH